MPDPSNIHVNLITPTSVSVELENHDCYETEPFEMFLNGSSLGMQTRNSFSLHGLEPGCDYELRLIKKRHKWRFGQDTVSYKAEDGTDTHTLSFRTSDRREVIYHSSRDGGAEEW